MKTRKKLMFLAILIFLLSASVSSAYAYWAGTVNAPVEESDTISINIGEGGTVTTVLTVNGDGGAAGQVLVPTGQTDNSVDPESVTEKVTVVYTVGWTGVTGATGTLNVATGDVTIDSSETYAGLVNVTITNASTAITTGTDVTVTVEVTLTEPADQDAYTAIAGKAIAISLTFNVEPNNVEPN